MTHGKNVSAEGLRHYGVKCEQHLSRVRLSHRLALDGLQFDELGSDPDLDELVHGSFEDVEPDLLSRKLRRGLHELHLTALKSDFELYLNRVLTVVWTTHFASLATKAPGKRDASLRDLAEAIMQGTEGREFVIERIVPNHGLRALVDALKEATGIELPKDLGCEFSLWSQIHVAFQVRHLIEHADGKLDPGFRTHVRNFWSHSSWGRRGAVVDKIKKIEVEEEDVICTYDAMRQASRLLTPVLLEWNAAHESAPSCGDT